MVVGRANVFIFVCLLSFSALADDDSHANRLLVDAVQLVRTAEMTTSLENRYALLRKAVENLNVIARRYPSTDLAVKLITGQAIGEFSLSVVETMIKNTRIGLAKKYNRLTELLTSSIGRTVAIEFFNIPSGSMIPTLLVGDHLFACRYAHLYSTPSLPLLIDVFGGPTVDGPPKRGDITVFKLPRDNETDFIKRIVGLPGDRIQVLKGVLHINGTPVKRERIEDYRYEDRYGRERVFRQYRETLPNGVTYMTLDVTPTGSLDNTQIYTVPADHYFAMGDNRDNSLDSRLPSVGFIPLENLVGRAQFIYDLQDEVARSLDDGWSHQISHSGDSHDFRCNP